MRLVPLWDWLRSRWLSLVALTFVFGLLWLELFSLPWSPVSPVLDPSWCGALIHFAALKLQFGKDVIFTYGPLSHLISFVYTGELFTVRVVWEFLSKTAFAAILCGTIASLPKIWRPLFFLFVLLFIWVDPIADALFFLVFSCLAANLFRERPSAIPLAAFAGLLFGVCGLIKFTYFLLGLYAIVLLSVFYLSNRRVKDAVLLASSFTVSLFLSWSCAGQSLSAFPAYVASSMDICFGYKEAMGTPAASNWIVAAGIVALLLGLIQCSLLLLHSRRLATLCVVFFFAGTGFLSWTRAFVRADDHVLSFFGLFPVALMAFWIPAGPRFAMRRTGGLLNLAVLLVCLAGIFLQKPTAITGSLSELVARLARTVHVVTTLSATREGLETQLVRAKADYDLPRVRSEVGRKTIDVFGYEQGIALLNNLNYTPRPIFQGYSAYSPGLIRANTDFYLSLRAPEYVLLKYQPIDERYPTSEDAGVLLQLLWNYQPLFDEQGYTLWKRLGEPRAASPSHTSTRSLLINEVCEIPAQQNVWVELDFPKSVRGRLRSLLYKPPPVEIHTWDSDGQRYVHRLVPSMSSSGFILNPQLESTRALLESAIGEPTKSVVSFLIDVPRSSRRYFQRRFICRIGVLPERVQAARDNNARKAQYKALFGEGSELELTRAFQSATEAMIKGQSNGFAEFSALHEAELKTGPRELRIVASGSDPQVLLPKMALEAGRRGILRIDIEVPADTGLQLFYRPASVSAFGDYHMDRSVRRGKNTVYFELSEDQLAGGQLRLDPGMVAGEYVITHFELRVLPPDAQGLPLSPPDSSRMR
jgi:hypothetical protein